MHSSRLPLAVLAVALGALAIGAPAAGASSDAPGDQEFEVILRDDVPAGTAPRFEVIETDLAGLRDVVAGAGVDQTIEMNGTAWISTSPADPAAAAQWGITSAGLGEAWTRTTGSADTVIAIVDTGVDADANLGGRLRSGASFVDGGDPHVDPAHHGT